MYQTNVTPESIEKNIMFLSSNKEYISCFNERLDNNFPKVRIHVFTDGEDGIRWLRKRFKYRNESKSETKDFPDLIVLDMKLNTMDGYDFIAAYNSYFNLSKYYIPLYIVIKSENEQIVAVERIYAGFKGFLYCPFDIKNVQNALNQKPIIINPEPKQRGFKLW
ncbi:MAG: hypothetical protein SGJ04_09945 [Bacteroidota bacterium]|nr:hypothetical protein [Bacteroidota bacterium]